MENKRIGVLAGVVGVFGVIVQHGPSAVLDQLAQEGFGGVIPMIGTMGQTITTYSLLAEIAGPLVTLLAAIGLGYYIARTVVISEEYRRIIGATAIGSTAGVMLVALPLLIFSVLNTTSTGFAVFFLIAFLVSLLISVALVITVGTFAGAALAHFQTSDEPPTRPAETRSDAPSDAHSDSLPENSHT